MPPQTRTAIVTGATGAIGHAIALGIAEQSGWCVYLLCRNQQKADRTAAAIRKQTGNDAVGVKIADLGSKSSIEEFVSTWQEPLHVLVNNAAVAPRQREETRDGIEKQFAVNVLGYLRLAEGLRTALAESGSGRIVNVASYWAGGLDIDDLEFKRRAYNNDAAYRQSKQADRMLSTALATRYRGDGIAVNACHPGDVNSKLSNDLGFGGSETPNQGAATPVWLATGTEGGACTGAYFEQQHETTCRFSTDRGDVNRLLEVCLRY